MVFSPGTLLGSGLARALHPPCALSFLSIPPAPSSSSCTLPALRPPDLPVYPAPSFSVLLSLPPVLLLPVPPPPPRPHCVLYFARCLPQPPVFLPARTPLGPAPLCTESLSQLAPCLAALETTQSYFSLRGFIVHDISALAPSFPFATWVRTGGPERRWGGGREGGSVSPRVTVFLASGSQFLRQQGRRLQGLRAGWGSSRGGPEAGRCLEWPSPGRLVPEAGGEVPGMRCDDRVSIDCLPFAFLGYVTVSSLEPGSGSCSCRARPGPRTFAPRNRVHAVLCSPRGKPHQ